MSTKKQSGKGAAPTPVAHRGRQGYSVGTSKKGVRTASRTTAATGGGGRGRLIAVIVVIVLVVVAAVAAFVLLAGGGDNAYAKGLAAAGCTDKTIPEMPSRNHLAEGEPAPQYNSDPPTSGKHQPQPALWGIYDSPIDQDILVHNLEHGGLVVQYGDAVPTQATVALRDAVLADRDFMLMAPYPKLGNKIAYTEWTRLVECTTFDQRVLDGLQAKRNQKPAPETPQDPRANRQANF